MIRHALAIALLGIGIGFAAQAPAGAAALSISGVAAARTNAADDTLIRVGGRCFELPIVGAAVAFVELLRDEEFDRHCDRHFDGDHSYRHTYDERKDLTAKGSGYAHPEHVERVPPR